MDEYENENGFMDQGEGYDPSLDYAIQESDPPQQYADPLMGAVPRVDGSVGQGQQLMEDPAMDDFGMPISQDEGSIMDSPLLDKWIRNIIDRV